MIIEEIIIEKMKLYPHLFDLTSKKYVDTREKNLDFQVIADDLNGSYHTVQDGVEVPLQYSGINFHQYLFLISHRII